MKKKRNRKISAYIAIVATILFIGLFIYKYNVIFVDSDASSALLYSKLLNYEHSFFSNNWYYATLVPVVEYQLIYMFLFSMFSNWLVVRVLGTIIILLLYVVSIYFCMKEFGLKHIVLNIILLLMPFSIVYFGMYIAMPWYVFTSIKIFLTIGLILKYFNCENHKKRILIIISISVLSLIQGLEGQRSIVQFIIPMILTLAAILIVNKYIDNQNNKSKATNIFVTMLCVFIPCIIGYAINILILAKQYLIASYSNINFIMLTADSVIQEINSWLRVFGYTEGSIFSTALIHNALCCSIIIISIIAIVNNIKHHTEIKKESLIYTLYYCFAVLIMICFGLFIDINRMGLYDVARYNIPVALMSIPLIVDWLENSSRNMIKRTMYVVFVVLMIVCGLDNYRLCADNKNKQMLAGINTGRVNNDIVELQDVVYMLKNEGYKNGYSYYWCGNVITELSNGDIEMWVLAPGGEGTTELYDFDEIYRWNQLKDHAVSRPEGKVFIILNQEELDYSRISDKLNWDKVIYNSDNYTVYGYKNYDELIEDFNNKN